MLPKQGNILYIIKCMLVCVCFDFKIEYFCRNYCYYCIILQKLLFEKRLGLMDWENGLLKL